MIYIEDLIEEHVGRWVIYVDCLGRKQKGRIKSWNDKWIFVVYKCDNKWEDFLNYTGCATNPNELYFSLDISCRG